jgi:two-component system, OmpR family, alkaline phosphatase synthesis response regulator PhoP
MSVANTVLVVDDEKNIVELARVYLRNAGFQVEAAYDGLEAIEKTRSVKPAIVVLDLMLPELDGMEVCRAIRKESEVPIIMLTARSDDMDKIIGLEIGADDYLTKPFNPRELVARIKAVLRRSEAGKRPPKVIEVGDMRIDVLGREASIAGVPVPLRTKEFDLMLALANNVGIAMARDRILNLVWGEDFFGDQRTLDVHVAWLRDKISASTAKIVTVWGFGYKLIVGEPAKAAAVESKRA